MKTAARLPGATPDDVAEKPALLRWVFWGNQGLRAGWSAFLFLAIFLVLGLGAGTLVRAIFHMDRGQPAAPGPSILREMVQLTALFIATLIMAKIENRSVLSYGFRDTRRLIRLASGTVVGFALVSGLVGLLWTNHLLVFEGRALGGVTILKYAALWGLMFLSVAFFEEGLLRVYLQYTLARGLNFWLAATILSISFGALHINNKGESPIGIFVAVVAGLVFALSLRLTQSLWWIVGVHTGWGWAEAYFYGVPNSGIVIKGHLYAAHAVGDPIWSGGAAGPEGSVYALLVLLLMAISIWLMWGKHRPATLS